MNKKVYYIAAIAAFVLIIASAIFLSISGMRNGNGDDTSNSDDGIDVRVSITPDVSGSCDLKDSNAKIFDMGIVTTVNNVIWNSENTFLVISERENHIWVYECNIKKNKTTQKCIIKLDEGEKYASSRTLDDGRICISTNKNIIFLNEKYEQDRSVTIRCTKGKISETSVNHDGTQFLYIDENGLSIGGVGGTRSKLLIKNGLDGEDSVPYKAGFVNDEADSIYYHYVASDRSVKCVITDINKSKSVTCSNVDKLSYFTEKYISVLDSKLATGLRTVKISDKSETLYRINDFIIFAIAGEDSTLYVTGITADTNKLVVEKIDLSTTTSQTILALNDEIKGLGYTLFPSVYGKCAVQVDKDDNGNASLLIFDKT